MSDPTHIGRGGRCVIAALIASAWWMTQSLAVARADEVPAGGGTPAAATVSGGPAANSRPSAEAQQARIEKLIQELGNPRYAARRAAASELRQIGAAAFDLLHAASEDSDPEIAASANYLLRQITVRWVQPDDSATVRAVLRQYGQEAEAARLQRVELLAKLPQNGGLSALCRIARYDRSPVVSRTAALAIIRPSDVSASRTPVDAAVVDRQLGASTRAAATWLHQYLAQQHDPAASIATWKQLLDQESARLDKSGETSNKIVLGLEWNLAELYHQVGDQPATITALDRMMELSDDESDETFVGVLSWLTKNQSWNVLDAFLEKHLPRLQQNKRPLYYAALARAQQGKHDLAEQLATSAAEIRSQGTLEGFIAAKDLEEHNQFEWAVREYRQTIEKQTAESFSAESMVARIYLAKLLHDHEREKEAAEVIEPLVKIVQGKSNVAELYARIREYYLRQLDLPEPDGLAARYHFYRACQYQAEKDLARAKDEFDLAVKFDPADADILIAMYQFPEADAKWRESVRQLLNKLTQQFQQDIDENPSDPTPYNQWAWLVSNTEGDFQKAIRYSHRSLELNVSGESGEASFLDTLGRCYYAAGDYENAVKYERQALAKVDYLQVMHRQMARFEKALAEKKAAKAGPEPPK
jgi:tetratricopeptide (TPR) repeat protein